MATARAQKRKGGAAVRRVMLTLLALVSGACGGAASAAEEPCRSERVDGRAYVICSFSVADHEITVHWRDADKTAYASLLAFKNRALRAGRPLVFAMNGGMYHDDLRPVGYHVEHRQRLRPANTRRGPGNFHMLPNGIFFIEKGRVGVMETRAFLRRRRRPQFATQSGPMLVLGGRLHPLFKPSWTSRKIRNGVGVSRDGRQVFFVLSDDPVTFYEFGRLFQRHLRAHNALFLDGSVSQMWSPTLSRPGFSRVGPIIAVAKRRP